jgi:hypothetical protein
MADKPTSPSESTNYNLFHSVMFGVNENTHERIKEYLAKAEAGDPEAGKTVREMRRLLAKLNCDHLQP